MLLFFAEIVQYSTHKQKLFLETELLEKGKKIQETQSASLFRALAVQDLISWKPVFSQTEVFHGFSQDFCKESWLVFGWGLFWVWFGFFFDPRRGVKESWRFPPY